MDSGWALMDSTPEVGFWKHTDTHTQHQHTHNTNTHTHTDTHTHTFSTQLTCSAWSDPQSFKQSSKPCPLPWRLVELNEFCCGHFNGIQIKAAQKLLTSGQGRLRRTCTTPTWSAELNLDDSIFEMTVIHGHFDEVDWSCGPANQNQPSLETHTQVCSLWSFPTCLFSGRCEEPGNTGPTQKKINVKAGWHIQVSTW